VASLTERHPNGSGSPRVNYASTVVSAGYRWCGGSHTGGVQRFPQPAETKLNLRRIGLRVFLALLVVNALLGIAVVLGGDLGAGGGRVLATSLVVTGGVMLGLASAGGRGRLGPIWMIGVGAAALGTVLWTIGIWTDSGADDLLRTAGTASVAALGIACASLLSLADIRGRARWTLFAAFAVVAALVALSTFAIWSDPSGGAFWRVFGVLSIALAALAVAIPVLHRVDQRAHGPEGLAVHPGVRYCPSCGAEVAAAGAETRCGACHATFTVTFTAS
jgi:hypothetical protein